MIRMKKQNKTTPPKNVDEYLQSLPNEERIVLEKVRKHILTTAPKAEEVISYQIPLYKYLGHLIGFAAFKEHCSLFIVNKSILKIFEKELEQFHTTGTTIHFTPKKPLPVTLIKNIIKERMKQNEGLKTKKVVKKRGKADGG